MCWHGIANERVGDEFVKWYLHVKKSLYQALVTNKQQTRVFSKTTAWIAAGNLTETRFMTFMARILKGDIKSDSFFNVQYDHFTANWLLAWRPSRAYRLPQLRSDGCAHNKGGGYKIVPLNYIVNQGTSFPERMHWRSSRTARQLDSHARHDCHDVLG